MAPYKAVCFDLDGTLLNGAKEISSRNREAIRKLTDLGVVVVLASGRMTPCVEPYQDFLGGDYYMVTYNGACARAPRQQGREVLFEMPLESAVCRTVVDWIVKENRPANYYTDDKVIAVKGSPEHQALYRRYQQITRCTYEYVESYAELAHRPASKILILTEDANAPALFSDYRARLPDSTAHVIPETFFIEVLHSRVSKGNGVEQLMKRLDIALESVVAFGDGHNDVEMLQTVGLGIAMKNAENSAKLAANRVSSWTNEEDAVARELEALFNM